MVDRLSMDVPSPPGGWGMPWPNVAEIESIFPGDRWTLVGGLMVQLHGINRGIDVLRPTDDIDIVLHVETVGGVASAAADAVACHRAGSVTGAVFLNARGTSGPSSRWAGAS